MHTKTMILSAVLLLGLTASGFADKTPADATPAEETLAVKVAMSQFYTSLNALLDGDAGACSRSGRTPTT